MLNVPVAISSQLAYYNLPGVNGHLDLNGTVLAMIYGQTITSWTDPLILAAQSPSIQSNLENLSGADATITVEKRSDSSGDTFLWTSYCNMSWSKFPYPASTSGLSGLTGSHVLPETGNSGMVTGLEGQPGAIAYIGISYMHDVSGSGLNYAALGDNLTLANGSYANSTARANYILPTPTTIAQDTDLGLTHLNYASLRARDQHDSGWRSGHRGQHLRRCRGDQPQRVGSDAVPHREPGVCNHPEIADRLDGDQRCAAGYRRVPPVGDLRREQRDLP